MKLSDFQFFAEDHHGLLTKERALRAGVSESDWYRALRRGQIEYVHPGVARTYGSTDTREQRIAAAVLAGGHGSDGIAPVGGLPLGRPETRRRSG